MQNINWNSIRSLNGSQKDGFEELVCQLARNDYHDNAKKFIRKGSPDAGVECFWILDNYEEICYQAKFFLSPLTVTQWRELDDSVKTAIDKHPNLVKYIISIPQDRADARLEGKKAFLDKWDASVVKWETLARDRNLKVEFIFEGSSELLDKLSNSKNIGKTLFWFDRDEYTDEWFFNKNQSKIRDLDERYSPEINIDSKIKYVFDGLFLNKRYLEGITGKIEKSYALFQTSLLKLISFPKLHTALTGSFQELIEAVESLDFIKLRQFTQLKNIFQNTYKRVLFFIETVVDDNQQKDELRKDLQELIDSLYNVYAQLSNFDTTLAEVPFLIVDGDAGVGKSHLIADVVTENCKEGKLSILLLGQHFNKGDVWEQIKNQLDIKVSKEELLGILDSKAEAINSRIIIFIDALNEGEGKYLWKSQLSGFIEDLKRFSNIGLVLSVRTTYQDIIFPDSIWSLLPRFEHRGFDDSSVATKVFFEYYQIQEPPIPILNPEFKNPLFLKLFCLGLNGNGLKTIPQDYDNLHTIFRYLLQSVNKNLSLKLDFDHRDFDLVSESIAVLVTEMLKNPSFQISRSEARRLLTEKFRDDVDNSRNILSELFNENILTENVLFDPVSKKYTIEVVYFSYERLGDYLIIKSLLERDDDKLRISKPQIEALSIYPFLKDENALIQYQSFVEILSILLPEKYKIELYELIDSNENYEIGEAFVKSLIWRNGNTLSIHIYDYLSSYVLKVNGLLTLFEEVLIQLSSREKHYLNANFLHNYLLKMEMNERDMLWTIRVNHSDIALTYANWILDGSLVYSISRAGRKLISICLTWFLTSSNRELRDVSTKSLVKIFQNDLVALKDLLIMMNGVNDMYVLERLYAVAYGATIRTQNKDQITEFGSFVYEEIFCVNPPEHLLLRDYARGVIEYAHFNKEINGVDLEKIKPPYDSKMPEFVVTEEEVEKFKIEDKRDTQNNLYGLIMGGSDFARYTLGTNYHSKISNISISSYKLYKKVAKSKKYKPDLDLMFGLLKNYKSEFVSEEWKSSKVEIINSLESIIRGLFRLTQKDALLLHDYLDKIADTSYSGISRFDHSILQRLIVKDIFETYNWVNESFSNHDYRSLRDDYFNKNTYSKNESIGKKYALLSYYKWLAVILDNYLIDLYSSSTEEDKFSIFTGPWCNNRRDIDPTTLDRQYYKEETYKNKSITFWFPEAKIRWDDQNFSSWVLDSSDLVFPAQLINVFDNNGSEWLNLYSFPSWYDEEDSDLNKKQVWYHIKSYIIQSGKKDKIIKTLTGKSFFNHQIPQEQDIHEVYSREFFWSPAYSDCTYENHPEYNDKKLHSEVEDHDIVGYPTSMNYSWDKDHDFSLNEGVSLKRPTKYLYNLLQLHFKDSEHEFYNEKGEMVLYNPSIKYQGGNDCLLVKKDYLIALLKQQGLDIIWLVLGAKEVVGDMNIIHEGDINSVFYLDDALKVNGEFKLVPYKES